MAEVLDVGRHLEKLKPFLRPYRRKDPVVTARQLTEVHELSPRKNGDILQGSAGDWLVSQQVPGCALDEWVVSDDIFRSTYSRELDREMAWVPPRGKVSSQYRKVPWTSMVKMDRDFLVGSRESRVQHGRSGDYLALGVFGEPWIISEHVVEEHYRPIERPGGDKPIVFVSYSHEGDDGSASHQDAVKKFFIQRLMDREEDLEVFHDKPVLSGEWQPKIQQWLAWADLVVLLVDDRYIAGYKRFARAQEAPLALLAHDEHMVELVPVVCDDSWKDSSRVRLMAFGHPESRVPLNRFTLHRLRGRDVADLDRCSAPGWVRTA